MQSESIHSNIEFQNIDDLTTIADWIRFSMSECARHNIFLGHGTNNLWDECEHLVFLALDLPLLMSPEQKQLLYPTTLLQEERSKIASWLQLRTREAKPLPYISNVSWFAQMPFYVDERVLIPRSPFAELIENGFTPFVDGHFAPANVLDMCTGSACIAIALAQHFEDAVIDAVDIDMHALEVAAINIGDYQLEERVYPIQSDLFESLAGQKYDLIIANPPYVDAQDMGDLPSEYHHEPEHALASGNDGLDLTMQIMMQAVEHLQDDGWLFVEVGNSEVNFADRFGDLEVTWCELKKGGSGIFAISKAQLIAQQDILDDLE
ncbi:50S ribosomal protein L3 N(5)-glutamine methyltransferase [Glaciecola sp. XM2]|uniref:50S ribosomal protein L3 N(5)-glutamine methyltransferase n=1 Tax=Glaciecola sp. XM2 TaxID=1914931 RepID=UPI001BDE99A5|nr:50S ribosomal protein L3 N(5)-glutamine methyltransferase [Glaciecola sp. XM2]MBT1450909.1 50S ribosomal protein L3 N(5)-glutamine methyltransferase [Glaciecola sp. XM2]